MIAHLLPCFAVALLAAGGVRADDPVERARAEVEVRKERVAWAERMVKMKYLAETQLRSVVAAAGFVLALVGIGVFAALGYTVWVVKAEADRQLAAANARAELAADTAAHTLGLVRDVIGRAGQDLTAARVDAALQPQK